MKKKLYVGLESRETTQKLIDSLRGAGLQQDHIFIVSNNQSFKGTQPAGFRQTSDFNRAAKLGLGLGALLGLLGYFVVDYTMLVEVSALVRTMTFILSILVGALASMILSGVAAAGFPSHALTPHEELLDNDGVVVIVEPPAEKHALAAEICEKYAIS